MIYLCLPHYISMFLFHRCFSSVAFSSSTKSCSNLPTQQCILKDMATIAFVGRDNIPLFAGAYWGYKFNRNQNPQLEGESLRLWTTYLT